MINRAPIDRGLVPLVESYLLERSVVFFDRNKKVRFKVFTGCPQGSCLVPLFWTLIAD